MLSRVSPLFKRFAGTRSFASASMTVKLATPELFRLDEKEIPKTATLTTEEALKYYKDMQMIRKMEIASDILYKDRFIRGFCHLYDGQESICVGMEAGVTFEDMLITAYRDHGQAFCRGHTVTQIIAEMMGKYIGSSKGKGGSMHYYSKKNNFYGGNGIVGAQCAVGTGLGFALKYQNKKNIAMVMYGDGAANQGQLFEAANMAKLWNLPVVYIIENNLYGMGTSIVRAAANTRHYTRLDPIPGMKVNARNILAVRETMRFAKNWCNAGKGPLTIEFETYRYHGHSMSDPGLSYRSREEIQNERQKYDCILQLHNFILDGKLASADQLKQIERECKDHVEQAVEAAKAAPAPPAESVYHDVYVEKPDAFFCRGVEWEHSIFPEGKPY